MRNFKKTLLALTFSFIFSSSYSQNNDLPKIANDTLYTTSGFKITSDQEIKIGVGSTQDGDFKFIRRNNNSLFAYSSTNQSLANSANAFPRNQSGYKYKIRKIVERGNKKRGFVYLAIIGNGIVNFEIDVENAIATGEIVVPDIFKPKTKSQTINVNQNFSVSDEILKLKKLLDDGIINQSEFNSQKKKLLEKSF